MTPEELEKLPKPLERTMAALELAVMKEIIKGHWNARSGSGNRMWNF